MANATKILKPLARLLQAGVKGAGSKAKPPGPGLAKRGYQLPPPLAPLSGMWNRMSGSVALAEPEEEEVEDWDTQVGHV